MHRQNVGVIGKYSQQQLALAQELRLLLQMRALALQRRQRCQARPAQVQQAQALSPCNPW
jgi:hypothetical protein